MDNYKFGNFLCASRETLGLTQKELARILDVSDKAVSKWENGQAVPRMETLEKLAQVYGITADELILIGRENVKRIRISNASDSIVHFQIDEEIISLRSGEEKFVLLDQHKRSFKASVHNELDFEDMADTSYDAHSLKSKIINRAAEKVVSWANRELRRSIIHVKCFYLLSDIKNEQKIIIQNGNFSAGDKLWITKELEFSYPRLICDCRAVLVNAKCINKTEAMLDFRKKALTSELGISIPLMLIAYPFRKMYFKSVLKPKGLMKYLLNADKYIEKNEKEQNKYNAAFKTHPVLKAAGIFILFCVLFIGIDVATDILFINSTKPVLVSADYSTVYYYGDEYSRIDSLPAEAIQDTTFGIEMWYDARIDGFSRCEQYFDENKVTEFTDSSGNSYIWLVLDYPDSIIGENGEYLEYDELDVHYVYALKK